MRKLQMMNFQEAPSVRNVWAATADVGTTMDDIMNPAYFAHVSAKLRPWDHIEVRAEDGTFYAELLVLATDRQWAKVHVLRHEALTTPDVSESQAAKTHEVKWRGPVRKFGVIRLADKTDLGKDFQTKDEAETWLKGHLQALEQ